MDGRYVRVDLGSVKEEAAVTLFEVLPGKVPAETEENHQPSLRAADVIGRVETENPNLRHKPLRLRPTSSVQMPLFTRA
jgi:hypothetical protein